MDEPPENNAKNYTFIFSSFFIKFLLMKLKCVFFFAPPKNVMLRLGLFVNDELSNRNIYCHLVFIRLYLKNERYGISKIKFKKHNQWTTPFYVSKMMIFSFQQFDPGISRSWSCTIGEYILVNFRNR